MIPKSSSKDRIKQNFQGCTRSIRFCCRCLSLQANWAYLVSDLPLEDFMSINQITIRDPSKLNRFVDFDAVWGVNQFRHS